MRDVSELQRAIERQRSRVNAMIIEYGTNDEELIRENHKLDQLIELLYIESEAQEEYASVRLPEKL